MYSKFDQLLVLRDYSLAIFGRLDLLFDWLWGGRHNRSDALYRLSTVRLRRIAEMRERRAYSDHISLSDRAKRASQLLRVVIRSQSESAVIRPVQFLAFSRRFLQCVSLFIGRFQDLRLGFSASPFSYYYICTRNFFPKSCCWICIVACFV